MSYRRGFVARDAGNTYDYNIGDLGAANQFNDLDLSAIVPAGAKAILIKTKMLSGVVGEGGILKCNGHTQYAAQCYHVSTTQELQWQGIVPCDSGRVIEQYRDATNVTVWSIVVLGWFF